MPATPNLALPYPAATDTADVPRDMQALATKLDASGAIGTALPGSPTDGQEYFYLADATNGVVWQLRYRAAAPGAYKWLVIGGTSLYANVEAQQNTSSGGLTDLTTVGPQFNVPLAGDYLFRYGASITIGTATFAGIVNLGVGGVFGTEDRCSVTSTTANDQSTVARESKVVAVAAGALAKLAYFVTGGSSGFGRRWIDGMPIRVG